MLIAFNKPYGVLSQFTPEPGSQWRTLAGYNFPPRIYPVGRLDADSEGMLLLSDERALIDRLLDPRNAHPREYHVQVENIPSPESISRLATGGIPLGEHRTRPCRARLLEKPPDFPPRDPPIRVRKSIPDAWISIELTEGKNRQVRRMTAAVGHPTLRLVRVRIGSLALTSLALAAGRWRELTGSEKALLLS